MTSPPPGAAATRTAPAQTAAADVAQAAAAALVVGTALGLWCRAWTEGSGGPVGAVLAGSVGVLALAVPTAALLAAAPAPLALPTAL